MRAILDDLNSMACDAASGLYAVGLASELFDWASYDLEYAYWRAVHERPP